MRLLITLLVFVGTLLPTAFGAFFAVMLLVGPHGGILPSSLESATLALGWLCTLIVPLLIARRTWRRYPH